MRRKGTGWIILGLLLIAAALFLALSNTVEDREAGSEAVQALQAVSEALPEQVVLQPSRREENLPELTQEPEIVKDMLVEHINGRDHIGVLRIPALGLELPIISQWSYPDLRVAPCRYRGNVYSSDLVICAHNYATHFGRLRELHSGDEVSVTDMEGNVFVYLVSDIETIAPSDTEAMIPGDWDLTLFTCTVGGQSRVALRCVAA